MRPCQKSRRQILSRVGASDARCFVDWLLIVYVTGVGSEMMESVTLGGDRRLRSWGGAETGSIGLAANRLRRPSGGDPAAERPCQIYEGTELRMSETTGIADPEEAGWKLPATRASLLILQEADGGPLHYRQVTERIIQRNLVATSSESLERIVYSSMSRHIRSRGDESWFRHAGEGKYALTERGLNAEVWRHGPEHEVDFTPPAEVDWSFTKREAAERVLRDASKPLHYREIAKRSWKRGLHPMIDGRYPFRSFGNVLSQAARAEEEKEEGGIVRTDQGVYTWNEGPANEEDSA